MDNIELSIELKLKGTPFVCHWTDLNVWTSESLYQSLIILYQQWVGQKKKLMKFSTENSLWLLANKMTLSMFAVYLAEAMHHYFDLPANPMETF